MAASEIVAFLTQKWQRELDYVLRKSLWDFHREPHRGPIPIRMPRRAPVSGIAATETNCGSSRPDGLMSRREASINDVKIDESERRYFGPRPESEYGQDILLW